MTSKLGVVSMVLATTFHVGPAAAKKLYTIDVNGDGRQLAYAYCIDPDPWVECVSHELKCSGEGLVVMLAGEAPVDTVKAAKALIDMGPRQASVRFLLAEDKSIDLWAPSFEVQSNDLDGTWDLQIDLHLDGWAPFWGALSESSVRGARFGVGDQTVSISPDQSAEVLLMKMKAACEKPAQ